MVIFDIILKPFLFLIQEIFFFCYSITGNYGLSIVMLSLGISALLLPIFIFIEKAKRKNDAIKLQMKPLADEIKRCYKGQERFYYLRTLNRQHNHSPLKSLIPVLSLLIQIPFFIAAYEFLDGYSALENESFLFIGDLSKPDGLLESIHLLPVLMTVINLFTALVYTRNSGGNERLQMIVVAGIFLILLFNLPSGLVLYWTMNNLFGFFRLFLTNPELFKKNNDNAPLIESLNIGISGKSLLRFFVRLGSNSYVFFGASFIAIYLFVSALFFYKEPNIEIAKYAVVIFLFAQVICVYNILRNRTKLSKILFYSLSVFMILILSIQLFYEINFDNSNYYYIGLLGVIFTIVSLAIFIKRSEINIQSGKRELLLIYLLSVIYVAGLVLFWNPLLVYSTFPEAFSFPAFKIITDKIIVFIIILFSSALVFFVSPVKQKTVLAIVLATLVLVSLVHSTILPIKLGTLQMGKYIHAERLAKPDHLYMLDALFAFLSFVFIEWVILKKNRKVISWSIMVIMALLIGQSLYKSFNTGVFFNKNSLEPNKASKIQFSKNEENIVFVIADMFMGWYLNDILKDEPQLKEELEGFVWYPNTISVSSITSASICPILEGYDYTVDKLNKDTKHTVSEKVSASTERFFKKVKAKGYAFTANKMVYSKIDKKEFDYFIPKWNSEWDRWNEELSINIGQTKDFDLEILWENALLYASPLAIKPVIYNEGAWINSSVGKNENNKVAKLYNFMRVLPFISSSESKSKNFIYYHTRATHLPWNIVNEKGELIEDVPSYENQKWFLKTFAQWIKWMKEEDVYDNTKIVLLSDHSHFLEDEAKNFGGDYKWSEEGQAKISANYFWRLNALLLVKDFNSQGKFKEDWRLMSNADASAILFDENNPIKGEASKRELPTTYVEWVSEIDQNYSVEITHNFLVKDTIYFLKNWKRCSE